MNHVEPIPEAIPEGKETKTMEEKNNSVSNSESRDGIKNLTPHCENGVSTEVPHMEQGSEHTSSNSNGKRKDKSKRTINGLIKSIASPERVSKDIKDTSEACPEPKKVKVENENSVEDKDVEDLLSNNTLVKMPNQPLQTQATSTAMETVSTSSSEDTKHDLASLDSAASSSAQCSDDSEKSNGPVENSQRRDTAETSHEHNNAEKDSKPEKKNSEQHHRKHKKRKEKKKHRHTSGNDSTGSDAPGSPLCNQAQGVFSSPRRPRMSFDMDLGKTRHVKYRYFTLCLSMHLLPFSRTQNKFLLASLKSPLI